MALLSALLLMMMVIEMIEENASRNRTHRMTAERANTSDDRFEASKNISVDGDADYSISHVGSGTLKRLVLNARIHLQWWQGCASLFDPATT
jgi:hypothetical protein